MTSNTYHGDIKSKAMLKVLAGLCLITPLVGCAAVGAQEVRVYSGRHYNTDRQVFKRFSEKTGIKVRLIEATGISLVERLKREGSNSKADVILLAVSYTHLRAHETKANLVCRLLLEKKKN